jgi:hypothetical protein
VGCTTPFAVRVEPAEDGAQVLLDAQELQTLAIEPLAAERRATA